MTITAFLEAAKLWQTDNVSNEQLAIAASNAAKEIEELVDLCRTALNEGWYEDDPRWDRIREIVGGGE